MLNSYQDICCQKNDFSCGHTGGNMNDRKQIPMVMDHASSRVSARYPESEVARSCDVPPPGSYHYYIEVKKQGLARI
jgi:hypothetical protein